MRTSELENTVKAVNAARKRMNAKAVGYSVSANAMPASQESAPFLGRASAADTCDEDELADAMVEDGCQVDKAGIKLVWNTIGGLLLDKMPTEPRRFDLGFVSFEPKMKGSLATMDADFDDEVNGLYVGASPSDAIRDALAGGVPSRKDGKNSLPEIFNVQSSDQPKPNTVKAGEWFDILGRGISCSVGDEHAAMKLPNGTEVEVELEMQTPAEGRQRITGRLPQSVAPCEGAKLTLWMHVIEGGSPLPVTAKGKIAILAGDPPPPPEPIAQTSDGQVKIMSVSDGGQSETFTFGDEWTADGEGFTGSAAQWFAELASVRTMPEADAVMASCQAIDANTLKIECDAGDAPAAGDYPDATLEIGMAHYVEGELVTESLTIPIHLVVE